MKKIFTFLGFIGVISISFLSFSFYKNTDFWLYIEQKNIEKESPGLLPDKKIIKITSLGHENSYADFLWIDLIQYIGNNVSKKNYTDFSLQMIHKITEISPKFTTAYEWALWLMPIPQNSNVSYTDEQKKKLEFPLQIAEKWIQETCNPEKIITIFSLPLGKDLWEKSELKNPCKNGMIPYLIAFYGGKLTNNKNIERQYYKLSSMQDDAPEISKVLATFALSDEQKSLDTARNFALMSLWAYDEEPYQCYEWAEFLIQKLTKKRLEVSDILAIQEKEKNLMPPKKENLGNHTCYEMLERSIKYTYIAFINDSAKKYDNIENINELITKIWLKEIPIIQSQKGMSMRKINDSWEYFLP